MTDEHCIFCFEAPSSTNENGHLLCPVHGGDAYPAAAPKPPRSTVAAGALAATLAAAVLYTIVVAAQHWHH